MPNISSESVLTFKSVNCEKKQQGLFVLSNRSWSISISWSSFIQKINNWKVCERNDATDAFKLREKANATLASNFTDFWLVC